MIGECEPLGAFHDAIDVEPDAAGTAGHCWTEWVVGRIRLALAALSFWSAIALPAIYLPLLIMGIESTNGLVLFLGLYGLHVVSLFGGRRYHESTE